MDVVILTLFALATVLGIAWMLLPLILARSIRPTRAFTVGQKDPPHERSELVARILRALDEGTRLILCSRQGVWIDKLVRSDPKWRPVVLEGAGLGFGMLSCTAHRRWKNMNRETASGPRSMHSMFCRGAGIWAAKRFGRDIDHLLAATKSLTQQERIECLDGYGFKYGLFEFVEDRRNIAHLHGIPGPYRRAAFAGVGRALYYLFLSNHRGLIEVVADCASEHDGDVMEGAGYAAALIHCDEPRRAINFARAMPYEWRAQVHLGMTLAWRDRASLDPDYFRVCIAQLPLASATAITEAIAMSDREHHTICEAHPNGGYYVWRERLTSRLGEGSIWEPLYADAMREGPSQIRGLGIKKEESK